ncbi:MAG: hypothetical protein J6563_08860 [Gilliamella sp.]|uniref:hypothetical protein n=1 Tax=Gilliamella sp. TaxID=1891236 RepID=UPI0026395F92|nr:hypothetical protein [Gilliamella sp.]MCO6553065.1 hypothetical protein [Gilliamella sp.]
MASGIWHLACQTYALNLIDSHGSQSRAPQLFSSPKSFRVAKSTPSSAKSSAKLSPISKWLSKPLLLSKSALFFAPLLLLSYTQDVQALTAQTSREIEGSAPYLTFDGGRTKATDTDSFLAIELPDGRTITPSTNTSSSTNPIMLPNGNFTFNDIHMVIPSGSSSTLLNSLISQGKWGDDDGDGQGVNGVRASGSISLIIRDKEGNIVNRGDRLSSCRAPYKLALSSTGGNLVTQYGVPNSSTFSGGRAEYYIKPDSFVDICYARPNLLYGGTTGIDSNDNPDYAGPPDIWSPTKGFLVQSTTPSSYNRNFPSTGLDGLYFDLDIVGVDASQLNWTVNTSGGISATVRWTLPNQGANEDRWITDKSKYVTRVTLNGPKLSFGNVSGLAPVSLPTLPQKFELVGRDSRGNEVKYGFELRKWFFGVNESFAMIHILWRDSCRTAGGYRIPEQSNLFSSNGNHYMRSIGGGLYSEWGSVGYSNSKYVSISPVGSRRTYVDYTGKIYSNASDIVIRTAFCVSN